MVCLAGVYAPMFMDKDLCGRTFRCIVSYDLLWLRTVGSLMPVLGVFLIDFAWCKVICASWVVCLRLYMF